jgi:hypothetical protein
MQDNFKNSELWSVMWMEGCPLTMTLTLNWLDRIYFCCIIIITLLINLYIHIHVINSSETKTFQSIFSNAFSAARMTVDDEIWTTKNTAVSVHARFEASNAIQLRSSLFWDSVPPLVDNKPSRPYNIPEEQGPQILLCLNFHSLECLAIWASFLAFQNCLASVNISKNYFR